MQLLVIFFIFLLGSANRQVRLTGSLVELPVCRELLERLQPCSYRQKRRICLGFNLDWAPWNVKLELAAKWRQIFILKLAR